MNSGRSNPQNSPHHAPRFQFSIWAIMVLITGTAVVLSLRHYIPDFVDFIAVNLLGLAILAGIMFAISLIVRGTKRFLRMLEIKLGLQRFWLFRFVRHVMGALYRLVLRRGSAANHLGIAYYREGQYDRAIISYGKAIELQGRMAAIPYCNRGLAWYKKGDFNRALADLESSLRLNPCLALAYSLRALVLLATGEYDRAIADCDKSLRFDARQSSAIS